MNGKLLIIRGIPGAGKTTAAKALIDVGAYDVFYEADQFFEFFGEYKFDASKLGTAHNTCRISVRNALAEGKRVIVSNTFTTWKEIVDYLKLAEAYGASVQILELQTNFGSIHDVPEDKIEQMRERFLNEDGFNAFYESYFGKPFPEGYYVIHSTPVDYAY